MYYKSKFNLQNQCQWIFSSLFSKTHKIVRKKQTNNEWRKWGRIKKAETKVREHHFVVEWWLQKWDKNWIFMIWSQE